MPSNKLGKVRKQILNSRGVVLEPHTRKPIPIDESSTSFPKSNLMKMLELKFSKPIEQLILTSESNYITAAKLGINFSTVSKWRKLMNKAKEAKDD